MIEIPGIYRIKDKEYFADPCPEPSLSASIAKTLITATPAHAADEHPRLMVPGLEDADDEKDDGKFDLGSAVHMLMLGHGGPIEEIDAKDWKSKAAQEQREIAYALGRTPLLKAQAKRARVMVARAEAQLNRVLGANPFAMPENNELALVWRGEAGIWCRCKPDALDYENRIVWDLKTTGMLANPQAWGVSQVEGTGIDMRAAHYLHGAARLLGPGWRYRFVVVEAKRPHCLSILELPGSMLDTGEDKRHRAAMLWGRCLALGQWRGWAENVVTVEEPAWLEGKWLARRDNPTSQAAIELAAEIQAPH